MLARTLIALGLLLALAGVLWLLAPRALSWFGQLPGDLRLERGGTRVFVPLASMLVVSALASLVLNALLWLLRKLGA